ncbi:MAG: pirin family protein [Rehaibacterium terrae]|uniref:pirin family protein n=1 Tax=Rehaibacterium terrae TaxID=1341696 RepID=UPI00391DF04A
MRLLRPAASRGRTRTDWLDSRHAFSFGDYHDPQWLGFGPLRVLNEDRVAPGAGFPPHNHANMEILTWVLDGALEHRDSTGGGGTIRPGELQRMSAGHGIEHSEYNASAGAAVHFLQLWLQPDRLNTPPGYAQRAFAPQALAGRWCLLAAPRDMADAAGAVGLRQDARLYAARLAAGQAVGHALAAGRRAWLQVARGEVRCDDLDLGAGDGLGVSGVDGLRIQARGEAEVILLDLP